MAQSLSKDAVFWAGRRITGGMIMGTDERGGIHENEGFEHFPRMHDGQGQRADRDDVDSDDAVFGIESADKELLSIHALKAGPEQSCRSNRRLDGS